MNFIYFTFKMLNIYKPLLLLDGLAASYILSGFNSKYLYKLTSYLNPVLKSSSRSWFVRCWRAKTDGWAASTFHSNCDGKGPTVTLIKVGSYIFGGYTDVSWSSKYQFMVTPFSLSLLFYSGVNVERSDLRIRCSPRQMCTNKFAGLVSLSAGAVRLVKARSKKRKKNIWRGEGKTAPVFFLFCLFVFVVCCLLLLLLFLLFSFRKLSFGSSNSLGSKGNDCYAGFQQRSHDISRLYITFTLFCSLTKRRLRKKLEKIEHL